MFAVDVAERNDKGQFAESPDSLHPKTIGLRLHKTHYPRFVEMAEAMGKRPTELAREIIESWMDDGGDRPTKTTTDPSSVANLPKAQRSTTARRGSRQAKGSNAQAFSVGDCVRLPSGDRAYVEGFKDGRVLIAWEVGGMKDSFPAHCLTLVHKAA